MARGELYEMACVFTGRETDLAVQIEDPATETTHWIPLSQVEQMHGRVDGKRSEGTIIMALWIAREKGLY
jgi:hypothetical protein